MDKKAKEYRIKAQFRLMDHDNDHVIDSDEFYEFVKTTLVKITHTHREERHEEHLLYDDHVLACIFPRAT